MRRAYSERAKYEYPLTGFVVCGHCGSPLIGACLSRRYRYYRCRGTYPTSSRERICDARYVKADWLEEAVWKKVKQVLSNPELLLAEVSKQTESEQDKLSNGNLDHEIKKLTRKLKNYKGRERRLMSVLRLDVVSSDVVLDELNQMKKERELDEYTES